MNIHNEKGPGDFSGSASPSGSGSWGIGNTNPHNPSTPGQPGQQPPSEQPTRPQTHPGNPQTDPQRLSPDPTKPGTPKTDPTYPETNPKHIPTPVSEYKKSGQEESFKNSDKGGALGDNYSSAKNYQTSPTHVTGKTESSENIAEKNDDIVDWINELVVINNDRTEGYKRAAEEIEDQDLKSLFLKYSAQSRQFHSELVQLVRKYHGEPAEGTKVSGKLYRVWMDIKAAITAKDRKAVISSCEFGEDEALNSYEAVCKHSLPSEVSQVVTRQKREILDAHDHIKSLRETEK